MRFEPGQDKVNIWTMENKAYTAPARPTPLPAPPFQKESEENPPKQKAKQRPRMKGK